MKVTPTGWLFLGMHLAFYLAAMTSQSSLLLLLAGVSLGCLVVNFVAARRAVRGITLEAPASIHLSEGERLSQPWLLRNSATHPARLLQAESPAGLLFRAPVIPAKSDAHLVPDLVFKKRGVFPLNAVRVASLAPFGLIKYTRGIRLPGEVVVGPAVYPAPSPHAAGYDAMLGGKFKGHRPAASGTYFAGVRPFQQGDSLRQVHWKSSAKGQGLMVKTFEEELSGRISILIDNRAVRGEKILDDTIRAAGSLMFAALDAGHQVEAIDFHNLEVLQFPPFIDGSEILDYLARLPASSTPDFNKKLETCFERLSKRSAISVIATEPSPEILEAVEKWRSRQRHVALYLPATSPGGGDFIFTETEIVEPG